MKCRTASWKTTENKNDTRTCIILFLKVSDCPIVSIKTRVLSLSEYLCSKKDSSMKTDVVPGRVAQSVGHLTRKSVVLGSIPGLATYFRFSVRFFKKGSCQLLAKVCARSTG